MSDMGRYRRLYVNEWHDPIFRALHDDSVRIVRFYVTAGPQTTSVGCFRLSTAVAVEDLGGTGEEFERRLDVVCEAFGWAWDPLARVIWVTNWFDINPPASPNVVNSWAKLMKNVPDCDVKTQAILSISDSLKNLPATFREPWRDLSKLFRGSESQPQVGSETNQGSGIREQRSGKQRTGARSRGGGSAPYKALPHHDEPNETGKEGAMIRIARETLRLNSCSAPIDDLIECFKLVALQSKVTCTTPEAQNAINKVLSESQRFQ